MSLEELKVSEPGEILPATRLVELPVEQGGRKPVIKIRALRPIEIGEAYGAIPDLIAANEGDEKKSWAEMFPLLQKSDEAQRKLAELAIIAPAFSFGGAVEGKAAWNDLHPENANALTNEILNFSGSHTKGSEAAAAAGRFPGGEGAGDGAGAGAALPAGEASASGAGV